MFFTPVMQRRGYEVASRDQLHKRNEDEADLGGYLRMFRPMDQHSLPGRTLDRGSASCPGSDVMGHSEMAGKPEIDRPEGRKLTEALSKFRSITSNVHRIPVGY